MGRKTLVPFVVTLAIIATSLSGTGASAVITGDEVSAGYSAIYYLNQRRAAVPVPGLVQSLGIEHETRLHATAMHNSGVVSTAGACDPSPTCIGGPSDRVERLWALDAGWGAWCEVDIKITVKKKTGWINKGVAKAVDALATHGAFCTLDEQYNRGGVGIDWKKVRGKKKVNFYVSFMAFHDST